MFYQIVTGAHFLLLPTSTHLKPFLTSQSASLTHWTLTQSVPTQTLPKMQSMSLEHRVVGPTLLKIVRF
jgi:hypothetical protein